MVRDMNISNEEIINIIEDAFKLKLYSWQKTYLFDKFEYGDYVPQERRCGKTFIYIVKLCISNGDPIKIYRWAEQQKYVDMYSFSQTQYNQWFAKELRYIYGTLTRVNIPLRTIYFTELQYRSRTKLML